MSMKIIKNITKKAMQLRQIELLANPMHLKRSMRISKICKKPTDVRSINRQAEKYG